MSLISRPAKSSTHTHTHNHCASKCYKDTVINGNVYKRAARPLDLHSIFHNVPTLCVFSVRRNTYFNT